MPYFSDYDQWKLATPWDDQEEPEDEDPFIEWATEEAERQEQANG